MTGVSERIVGRVGERVFPGWLMVVIAAICMFASGPGQSFTFSVFLSPISQDLGISSGHITLAYSIATLLAALLLPHMGVLLDRLGPRRMLMLVGVLLGLACLFFGAAMNFLWLSAGFALLRFLGQGSTMMGAANLVSQWFVRRRGFAMSLMALGFAAGMALFPVVCTALIDTLGWRTSWVVLALATWVMMLVPLYLLVVDRPESIALAPDNDNAQLVATTEVEPALSGLTLAQAREERAFYLLCLTWFVVGGLVTVLQFFQITVLAERGVDEMLAARMFAISAVVMVVAMPVIGRLFDIVRTRFAIAAELVLIALALFSITRVDSLASAVFYAVVFGLTTAFMMTMFGYIWPRYFGRAHLGSIQGAGQMVGVIGASLAPLPVGYAIDLFGSTVWVIRLLAVLSFIVAVVVVLWLRTPAGVPVPDGLE